MKILWVNINFLHPTTKGGQIRTLEMLRRLHSRNEIHYVALENPAEPEGPVRAAEYSSRAYPVPSHLRDKTSPAFAWELAAGLFSALPVAVRRHYNAAMARLLSDDLLRRDFDKVVCDFIIPAPHFPTFRNVILFQHNVETMIWRRRAEQSSSAAQRWYLNKQAERMFDYERQVSRACGAVLAVSENDAQMMREMFAVPRVSAVPTGVDIGYFAPPADTAAGADLVFVGSMDWAPNIDGVKWFLTAVLPRIRARRPACKVAIVGRAPTPDIAALAASLEGVAVTGTVPDIRPHLWGGAVSVAPLRIGGGTRLKIYESMAAKVAVVSTTIGAEGLPVRDGEHLRIADDEESFALRCLELLDDPERRRTMAEAAWKYVAGSFSWEAVAKQFEELLRQAPQWDPLRQ